jgi:AraC family ethanolamine operon transcriptional activator
MNTHAISLSPALSTVRCSNPEEFGEMLPDVDCRILPLVTHLSFFQAQLQLGQLRLAIIKRPPCISMAYFARSQIGIALAMNDVPGLKLNGIPLDRPALVNPGIAIPHQIFQPGELTIAVIMVPVEDCDRGWPERNQVARVDEIRIAAFEQLRLMIADIVHFASRSSHQLSGSNLVSGLQQSLLGAIDHAFLTAPGEISSAVAVRKYVRICRLVDEFVHASTVEMPSSTDIAAAAGVTIRTLHNAMIAVKGVSLQKFTLLNRLWAVRAALLRAGPEDLIKTIALDHGFWHLGRFSRTYRAFFGESPSETARHAVYCYRSRMSEHREERDFLRMDIVFGKGR